MIFNIIGYLFDICFALLSGLAGALAPKRYRKSVKHITDLVLGIKDTPDSRDKCYAVRVFDFPHTADTDVGDHTVKKKV